MHNHPLKASPSIHHSITAHSQFFEELVIPKTSLLHFLLWRVSFPVIIIYMVFIFQTCMQYLLNFLDWNYLLLNVNVNLINKFINYLLNHSFYFFLLSPSFIISCSTLLFTTVFNFLTVVLISDLPLFLRSFLFELSYLLWSIVFLNWLRYHGIVNKLFAFSLIVSCLLTITAFLNLLLLLLLISFQLLIVHTYLKFL